MMKHEVIRYGQERELTDGAVNPAKEQEQPHRLRV